MAGDAGLYSRADVLARLSISRHQLGYALRQLARRSPHWADVIASRPWGLYSQGLVTQVAQLTQQRRLLEPEVRFLVNRGRSEAAARRWLQRHRGTHPSVAPPPRRRR